MNAPEDALAGILAEHTWHHTAMTHCRCGFRTPLAQLALEGYLAHLAAVIQAEYVAEREAQAFDRGKNAAMDEHPSWWRTITNPYRARAEALGATESAGEGRKTHGMAPGSDAGPESGFGDVSGAEDGCGGES